MTDDISMKALSGGVSAAAPNAPSAPAATWCCTAMAIWPKCRRSPPGVPELEGDALRRTDAALAFAAPAAGGRPPGIEARFDALIARAIACMSEAAPARDLLSAFEEPAASTRDDRLVVDVDGFEGPLDLLLKLARDQKVDLTRISILALARAISRLHRGGAPSADRDCRRLSRHGRLARLPEIAAAAAGRRGRTTSRAARSLPPCWRARLRHLEAMREAGRRLMGSGRLGLQVFRARHARSRSRSAREIVWDASLYDLLSAYAALRLRGVVDAREGRRARPCSRCRKRAMRLMRLIGETTHWATLDSYLIEYLVRPDLPRHGARQRAFGKPGAGARRQGRAAAERRLSRRSMCAGGCMRQLAQAKAANG